MHINHTQRQKEKMQFKVLNIFQCSFFFHFKFEKCKTAWVDLTVINSSIQHEASTKETVWSIGRCFDAGKIMRHLKQL